MAGGRNDKLPRWLPFFAFIITAVVIRLYRTSSEDHYLLAGSDGPYFPLQVKALVEHFRLAFSDMPLLFTLGAILSKVLYFLHAGTQKECILFSVRFIDAFLPPLSAIPVFLIAQQFKSESIKAKFTNYLMVAFALLNFTPLFIFSYQLQKNGFAIFWVFLYTFYIVKILKYEKKSDFIKATIVIILCALTHFGSFGLLVFITLTTFIFWFFGRRDKSTSRSIKTSLFAALVLVSVFSLIAVFDFTRFLRMVNVPLKLFEAPVLLFALNGQNFVLHGYTLINLVTMDLLTIQAIFLLLHNRYSIDRYKMIAGLSFATCALLLSNPLLGLEWANRLFMLTFIPITVLYLIIFNTVSRKWITVPAAFIFILLLTHSFRNAFFNKPIASISKGAYIEFQQLKDKVAFTRKDAIVSRQDLRLLANWIFEIKGVSDYLLTKDEFQKYSSVYFVKQIKGKNPQIRGTEPVIAHYYSIIFQGEYFEIYKLKDNYKLPAEPGKIFKGVKGTIVESSKNKLLVRDYKTGKIRTVIINDTDLNISRIYNGMKVEINGEWTPFSLAITAEIIEEVETFD